MRSTGICLSLVTLMSGFHCSLFAQEGPKNSTTESCRNVATILGRLPVNQVELANLSSTCENGGVLFSLRVLVSNKKIQEEKIKNFIQSFGLGYSVAVACAIPALKDYVAQGETIRFRYSNDVNDSVHIVSVNSGFCAENKRLAEAANTMLGACDQMVAGVRSIWLGRVEDGAVVTDVTCEKGVSKASALTMHYDYVNLNANMEQSFRLALSRQQGINEIKRSLCQDKNKMLLLAQVDMGMKFNIQGKSAGSLVLTESDCKNPK